MDIGDIKGGVWCHGGHVNLPISYIIMVGIPADQNSPKWRSKYNIWNIAYWISNSLLYWDISHTHVSYDQVYKCNWNRYIEQFCKRNVHFHINDLSPNIAYRCYLNKLTFNGNLFSFIQLLTIFCTVVILYWMVITSNKYKSKYPNPIWWIMLCIIS